MTEKLPTLHPRIVKRTPVINFLLSAPIIYTAFFFILALHIFVEIYQQICFRLYGIKTIPAKKYFFIDRQKLSRLNLIEKFNCMYCGYANGFGAYFVAIAARTEEYWCAIVHESKQSIKAQPHTKDFLSRKDF